MTTALYRRYRPDTFQDVIGQDHVTAPLMAALRGDRVTHAYLFSGPRGCGKTTSARILARCLNCESFPTDTPCGQCPSCRDLATGGPGSLDVVEIDAASHNGVDDARDLRERAAFAPARDRFKIFILDEAHMVTTQGFNALLKLVEEPPAHVKFIFATTEPEKVIGTIRSRTHHYPFRLVPPDVLETYLDQLCQSEAVTAGPGVFPLVTRAGGGSVRDTLSVMDQLMGGALDGEVDYQRAVALLGYTDTTMLDQCVDAIAASDGAGVFRVVERVVSSGHDPRRFVEDLLQRLRDLLVIALAGSQAGPALGSVPQDELARMEGQSRTIGAGALSRAADLTAQALSQMVGATSPRLQLELLMARLLVPAQRGAVAPVQGGSTTGAPVVRGGASGSVASGSRSEEAPGGRERAAEIAQRAASRSPEPQRGPDPDRSVEPAGSRSRPTLSAQEPVAGVQSRAEEASVPERTDWDVPAAASPGGSREPQQPAGGQSVPAASAPHGASGSAADAEMIRTRWEEVLDAAKRSRRATWALVGPNSQPGSINGGVFQVLFTAQGLVGAFENGGHGPILASAVKQALGLDLEVHAALAGGPGGPGTGSERPGGPGAGGTPASGGSAGPSQGSHQERQDRGGAGATFPSSLTQPAASSAVEPPRVVGDDGWGQIAVPGAARAARDSATAVTEPAMTGPDMIGPVSADPADTEPFDAAAPQGQVSQSSAGQDVGRETSAGAAREAAFPVAPVQGQDSPVSASGSEERVGEAGGSARPVEAVPSSSEVGSPGETAPGAPSARSAQEPVPGPAAAPVQSPEVGPSRHREPGSEQVLASVSPDGLSDPPGEPPLATVHRLHALPEIPAAAPAAAPVAPRSASPQPFEGQGRAQGLAPVSWDGPSQAAPSAQERISQTFSDGVPLPQEPGDDEDPEDTWTAGSPSGTGVSVAMAAARAAARGEAPSSAGVNRGGASQPAEEDLPSEDDEDAEEAGVVGVEVVKRLLGAVVLEEITINEENR